MRATGEPRTVGTALKMSASRMSDEFDSLDATEKAGIEAGLSRCRTLAREIESELGNKRPEHFVDMSLAVDDMFRQSSVVVGTSREVHHQPRSGREVLHRRWGRGRQPRRGPDPNDDGGRGGRGGRERRRQ